MRARTTIALLTLLALAAAVGAAQDAGTRAYVFDRDGSRVPCPLPYEPAGLVCFPSLACGPLNDPQDLAIDARGDLYVADAGNARVLKVDPDGRLVRELRHPDLVKPVGVFADDRDGSLWVADGTTNAVLHFDRQGQLLRSFPPPRSEVLPEGYLYSPSRVIVDGRGWLLVIGTGASVGIIQIDPAGEFQGFFGANPAEPDLLRRIVRAIASAEQRRAGQRLQTLEPATDIALGPDGSIVTVTESLSANQIRRLNALGVSTYPRRPFGEAAPDARARALEPPRLAFVAVDGQGIVTVMDRASMRLLQYGGDGDLLFAWSGRGTQRGSFQSVSGLALDRRSGALYVLDGQANALQRLEPTAFARLVHAGSALYAEGRYEEALRTWVEVRRRDATYPLANRGIGKVLLRMGSRLGRADYLQAAMGYYRQAGDPERYSEAFAARRRLVVQSNMPALIAVVVALLVGGAAWSAIHRRRRKTGAERRAADWSPFAFWRVLTHPVQVMQDVRWSYGAATRQGALLVLGLYVVAQLAALGATAYHFAPAESGRIDLGGALGRQVLPWLTWVAANYLVTTILRGEGTIGRIFCASAYALVPIALAAAARTVLSHVLSLDESTVYAAIGLVGATWSLLLFLTGCSVIHDYGAGTTVGTSLLSLAGIVILWGIGVLVLGLVSTAVGFVIDVVREVASRA